MLKGYKGETNMAILTNHSGAFLNAAAAADFNRAEADHGVLQLNEAGRTVAKQQSYIDRWAAGGAANRPPYLYRPANPATSSNHVTNGGQAVDIANYRVFAKYCENYGFVQSFPDSDPVHFDHRGTSKTGGTVPNPTTRERQAWLISLGYDLGPSGADGDNGVMTKAGYAKYQTFLRDNGFGYSGKIDSLWGPIMQSAHEKYVASRNAAPKPAVVSGHTGTVADLAGLSDTRGLQKIAKLYGYAGGEDNKFFAGSQSGLQSFLNKNYGGSLATWLRAKWGYKDADDIWGPNMSAAATRANAANFTALK